MTSFLLHRLNPTRNERRYYRLEIGPCIGYPVALHRTWGRLDRRRSRCLIQPCADQAQAETLAARLLARKLKRGYIIVQPKEELK